LYYGIIIIKKTNDMKNPSKVKGPEGNSNFIQKNNF
jgi:hypothetical protein